MRGAGEADAGVGIEEARTGVERIGRGVVESRVGFRAVGEGPLFAFVAAAAGVSGCEGLDASLAGVRGVGRGTGGAATGVGGMEEGAGVSSATETESCEDWMSSLPAPKRSSSSCRFRSS